MAQLAEWLLPTPKIQGLSPNRQKFTNLYVNLNYKEKTKINKRPEQAIFNVNNEIFSFVSYSHQYQIRKAGSLVKRNSGKSIKTEDLAVTRFELQLDHHHSPFSYSLVAVVLFLTTSVSLKCEETDGPGSVATTLHTR